VSVRVKFVLVGVLLLLAIGIAIIATLATIQAYQGFQQQSSLVKADDVRSVSDWMTIPYIARTYHVPEEYLYQWLHITDRQKPVHATLRLLAARYHRTVNSMIQSVQMAIQAYRTQHPPAGKTPGSTVEPLIAVGPGYLQGDTGHLRRIVMGGRTPARGNASDLKRIVMGGRTPARGHPAPLTAPVPTMLRSPFCPYIVGTGVEWMWLGGPLRASVLLHGAGIFPKSPVWSLRASVLLHGAGIFPKSPVCPSRVPGSLEGGVVQ
jgi:hypothetical protein